ncbi:MAG: hypothetical protein M5U28_18685 [Sandaracinaceae bacterium]|nr:hypothetical protein [Sandaracinaceae bacterium]
MAFPGPDGSRASPELRTERDLSYEPVPREGVFHTDLWADWRLRDRDVPRWREGFGEPIPDGIIASVPGVLWTHTPGPIGGGDATEWERPRASHFWSGRGQMRSAPPCRSCPPFPCIQAITPWIARGVFGPAPVPWIGFSTTVCGIVLPDLNVVLRVGPDVFAGQPGFDPAWLREFEVPDVRWVAAAESDDWLPEEDLRYVGLSAGDLALRAMLVEQEGELIDVIKQQPCAPNQCEPVLVARTAGALAAAATPSPLLVLSARRRTLWSLDEVPASDARVRALDLGARTWRELVPQGEPLGRILAATYAPRDDVLWLLDEVGRGPRRTEARLVRVEVGLRNARARVVARWPRVTTNDRFALAVDPAGALYLAGTQARGALSVVVRIERSSRGHEPTGFVVREGGFVHEGLRANEHGVTLVLDDPDEGAFPILLDEMQPGRGGIAQCL